MLGVGEDQIQGVLALQWNYMGSGNEGLNP